MGIFEASDRLGGQLNLASKSVTRKQVWGIADWLINEVVHLGVDVRLNSYVEAEDVFAEKPDAVIVATGGWPEMPDMKGKDLLTTSWEVLGGEARLTGEVLVFDEVVDHPAAVCAEQLATSGCSVTLVTPDRAVAHDLGPTNSSVVLKALAEQKLKLECFHELISVEPKGNRKVATLRHVLTDERTESVVDHVVIENGTRPMDDIYLALKEYSRNQGQLDHEAMIAGQNPFVEKNKSGQFNLARVGDAISSRNIHAAIYDALRACKDI